MSLFREEPQTLFFKYNNENNGYLYLIKFITHKYKLDYNSFKRFFISNKYSHTDYYVLNNENVYIIDLKKIKFANYPLLTTVFEKILIQPSTATNSFKMLKYNFNVIIIINYSYINENYIGYISHLIEQYQMSNNFIIFSLNNGLSTQTHYKTLSLCNTVFLNPIKEFDLKYNKYEMVVFNMLHNDVFKTNLLLNGVLSRLKNYSLCENNMDNVYKLLCKNIKVYSIIDKYLLTDKIYDLSFTIITMYSFKYITDSIIKLIKFVNKYKLINNKFYLSDEDYIDLIKKIDIDKPCSKNIIKFKKLIADINNKYNNKFNDKFNDKFNKKY